MSIDREFRFLSKTRNSSFDGDDSKISVNEGKNMPGKLVNFVRDSTMKCVVPVLMLTFGGIKLSKLGEDEELSVLGDKNIENIHYYLRKSKSSIEVPDALRVAPKIIPQKRPIPTMLVSGEFFGEKRGDAPGEKYIYKTGTEYNYLFLYRKLSFEDYNKLFTRFIDVKQGGFGDCYLVSTIKSLARSRYFDTLMMTSIEKNSDGSFNLYLPLGIPEGKKIHISKEELNLAQIKGSAGYKILEVGFAKEALLKRKGSFIHAGDMPDIKLTKKSMKNIVGGSPFFTLATLLGYENIKRQSISNLPERRDLILNELNKFDPKNLDLVIVSSNRRPKDVPSEQKTYKVGTETMYYNHAYSLYAIEKKGDIIKSITLEDPTNNKRKIKLPLFEFMSSFYGITTCSPKEGFLSIV